MRVLASGGRLVAVAVRNGEGWHFGSCWGEVGILQGSADQVRAMLVSVFEEVGPLAGAWPEVCPALSMLERQIRAVRSGAELWSTDPEVSGAAEGELERLKEEAGPFWESRRARLNREAGDRFMRLME